jgi:sodium transport system ATP-binding protein
MQPAGVAIEDLTKSFGETVAVAGLSLTVAPGEIYGLLGPNGAGKTTTLRVLAGILTPSSGHAWVAGIEAGTGSREAKRRLGFLTGTTGLYARLTAHELLTYFGRLHGMSPALVRERIAWVARTLDFVALLDKRCETLSSGGKQRVSVARAVLHDPPVLILDEPTVGLDVLATRFLRDFVRAERARGKAVIYSTHYLAEAELLCDRIGLLYRGRMLAEGTPAALRASAAAATSLEEAFLILVASLDGSQPREAERS